MGKQNHLEFLEGKLIDNLDYDFLQKIKARLPYNNVYFLVCMAEVLNNFISEEKEFDSLEDALQAIIKNAEEFYLNVNISSVFELEKQSG